MKGQGDTKNTLRNPQVWLERGPSNSQKNFITIKGQSQLLVKKSINLWGVGGG